MYKIAFYGKGGIGKSTTVSNLSAALAEKGYTVMQIGCDPKADSTINLHGEEFKTTVLDLIREKNQDATLDEMVTRGYGGVLCVEAGGPTPGLGCAGRGIIIALDALDDRHSVDEYHPDFVFYAVLGDVVCGGFAMPIREGYADKVFILTSGEAMSVHAAMNIAVAVETFQKRGYAKLGGVVVNRRNVKREDERIARLCEDADTHVVGTLDYSETVQDADELHKTVIEAYPDSEAAAMYRRLADQLIKEMDV